MDSYLPIFAMVVLAIIFAGLSLVASVLLAPKKRPHEAKVAPYECGIVPEREPSERFPVRFYLVAMIFIIFDIEVIFLFPWAVVYNQLGRFGLIEILVFVGSVFIPFCYLVSNGALDWGPVRNLYRQAQDYVRTSATTVVRVAQVAPITTTATEEGQAVTPAGPSEPAHPERDPVPVPTGAAYGPKAG
jgi:NADH-quinone oxidoreductase subunit A